jgi:L-fuculose-phosphate aldolase
MKKLACIAAEMNLYSDMLVNAGLLHLKGGNFSARLGQDLVITRTRCFKQDLLPERLVRAPIYSDDSVEGASSTLSMHRAIYRKTDAQAILHAHPYYATLLSYYLEEFSPVDENGLIYLGPRIPIVAAPRFISWPEVAEEMADSLVNCPVSILRWHGAFAIGDSMASAFHSTQAVETAARFAYHLLRNEGKLGKATYPPYVVCPGAAEG